MARYFQQGPAGCALIRLDRRERSLLRQLLGELQVMLSSRATPAPSPEDSGSGGEPGASFEALVAGIGDASAPDLPADPVLARLLPDAYAPEVEEGRASADFRRYTEGELVSAKSGAARTVLEALDDDQTRRLTVPEPDIEAWLTALNDLRLALGVRLDVDEEGKRLPDPGDPSYASWLVYAWLTELQGSLIEVAAAGLDERR